MYIPTTVLYIDAIAYNSLKSKYIPPVVGPIIDHLETKY
jgi:hypothetical protein